MNYVATIIISAIVAWLLLRAATTIAVLRAERLAKERTRNIIVQVRQQQRTPRVIELNLERRRDQEIERSRWPSLERIYAEIERA